VEEHVDGGLPAGTAFAYRVRAGNHSGNSAWSNCASARTGAAGTPHAPTDLVAVATGARTVAVSWRDASSDERSFQLFRSVSGGAYALLGVANEGAEGLEDADAPGNRGRVSYKYRLRACNPAGCSPPSATARLPRPPAAGSAAPGAAGGILVGWAGVDSAATNVAIYRKAGACSSPDTWAEIARPAKSPGSYLDTAVSGVADYSYLLRAFRESLAHPQAWGYSAQTNCSSATAP
jgi:hypothetical protein